MNKALSVFLAVALLLFSGMQAEIAPDFAELTGLDTVRRLLDEGVTIEKVYYTEGFGFSDSEFTTSDPGEIALLWKALNAIRLGEKVDQGITDWYPQIIFYLSNGSRFGLRFEAHWLEIGGREHYALENDAEFWALTWNMVNMNGENHDDW